MKKSKLATGFVSALLLVSCSLDVSEKDSLVLKTETGTFQGVDPTATLTSAYSDLRGFGDQANLYALLEISSDELLCPTRGTDWGDNGVWRTIQQHTWDASHSYVLNVWNQLNSNVYKLNQLLDPASSPSATQTAQGKFLRAYNMYLIFDLYRQIPMRNATDASTSNPTVMTGQAAFDYIAKDLSDALAILAHNGPTPNSNTFKATAAAANFLQAKLYLNKFIYLNEPSPAAADMNKVIASVDAITADGFSLEANLKYFEIFLPGDDTETILWTDTGVGNRMWCGLHYYQAVPDNTGGGWNGFTTTADFYNLFEGDPNSNVAGSGQEMRRGFVPTTNPSSSPLQSTSSPLNTTTYGIGYGFLVGQQYDKDGNALNDRSGNPLVFSKTLPSLNFNDEKTGIRVLKYHPSNGAFTNHEVLFRYADAVLMKAEAILRGGTGTLGDTPAILVNSIRTNQARNSTSHTLSVIASPTLTDVLNERGRELYIEGWRRNDMIRFGTFTTVRQTMPNSSSHTIIYPIPINALASNPNLKQNPGY